MNVFETLDENAIYMSGADHATFPVLYMQAVEGIRPDVSIGNKYGYPEESLYRDMSEEIRSIGHPVIVIPAQAGIQVIIADHDTNRANRDSHPRSD